MSSTSKIGFYPWMLENLEIRCNMKIMDLGCGNGAFWKNVAKKLPSGLEIHLLDYSEVTASKILSICSLFCKSKFSCSFKDSLTSKLFSSIISLI